MFGKLFYSQTGGGDWATNGEGWGTSGGGGSFDRQTSVQSQGGTSGDPPQGVLPPSASQEGVVGGGEEEGAVPAGDQLKAVALYSFESQNADELTVTENEEVTVILGTKRFYWKIFLLSQVFHFSTTTSY